MRGRLLQARTFEAGPTERLFNQLFLPHKLCTEFSVLDTEGRQLDRIYAWAYTPSMLPLKRPCSLFRLGMGILNPNFGIFRTWSLELPLLFSRFERSIQGAKGRNKGPLSDYREVTREQPESGVGFIRLHSAAVNLMSLHGLNAVLDLQSSR